MADVEPSDDEKTRAMSPDEANAAMGAATARFEARQAAGLPPGPGDAVTVDELQQRVSERRS